MNAVESLGPAELDGLAADIRAFLVDKVSAAGGHLGSNLGVVELTIALHRVFRSPHDVLLFDTGHQSYVHKVLTGRAGGFDRLRQAGGMSGYPAREESAHDVIENSHASTALSYADGVAKAFRVRGEGSRRVVAVVGDGALTGGMCWEALNNLGASPDLPVVVVLNDNGRSYAPTVGGLAAHLDDLRSGGGSSVFERMGLAYVGPVDGHDVVALETAFRTAASCGRPVVVHCVTRKGKGYAPAENDGERMHAVGVLDPSTGRPVGRGGQTWTSVFGEEIAAIGASRPDVVCLTAAMPGPVGLGPFAARFPDRVFDVGIAEQHAVTAAAGMAMTGLHPVVAVYSVFLSRAFDQVLMDVALHGLPVTFVLDRAGITGPDGASHHGMWDASVLPVVPGIRIGAPRDAEALRALLREAVEDGTGPTVVRYPKAAVGPAVPAVRRVGGVDVLRFAPEARVLLVGVGALAGECLAAADALAARGVQVTVVDPRWTTPLDPALVEMAAGHRLVVAVEDTVAAGSLGGRLAQALAAAGSDTCASTCALPSAFVPHGSREQLLSGYGLDADGIAAAVLERLDSLGERVGLRPVA
ncbi:1-deoxy-D-xylulose-5-phosphate synthase [Saccharothrix variisporea]|uniref:1-deoxy-D-xylulose-5-phosphate synthase n=1 Tax=Saccharothrix variisporea TaxID=543527 RepID=A0A495X8F7_9PSEU|nr:1-deoxy-D-xylulose-5-phosphate synthase [Saccharothrix variisporea]RKT70237.1 1-deoxy-D-xylulose-5-phosphate synthase [Saccharothrix variisporea]